MMKKTLQLLSVVLVLLLSSCGEKEQRANWDVKEGYRTLFFNSASRPLDIMSDLTVVTDKTEIEMLGLQAEYAKKSNDSTLYFLTYEGPATTSTRKAKCEITKALYQIDLLDAINNKTILHKNEKTESYEGLTEEEIVRIAKDYTSQNRPGSNFVFTATVKQL